MLIGLINNDGLEAACRKLGYETIKLPVPDRQQGRDALGQRVEYGQLISAQVRLTRPDILIDRNGVGLCFCTADPTCSQLQLAHESLGTLLCSVFEQPVNEALRGLPWNVVWQCLLSTRWIKLINDRAHALELIRFGVPNVLHLPLSAPSTERDTSPLQDASQQKTVVFLGDPAGPPFATANDPSTVKTLPGFPTDRSTLEGDATYFYDSYCQDHGLGICAPRPGSGTAALRWAAGPPGSAHRAG